MLMLVIVAIMPALIILLYSGLEQRRRSIEYAKNDISEKKKADTMLAEEKERLDVTMRSIGDGVITTDCSGNIVLINKVAEHLTGWSHAEAAGRPLEDVFHIINEQTRKKCENPVFHVITSGEIVSLANHTVLVSRHGGERMIADSGAPILDANNKIFGAVLVFRDVTERVRTEKELLKIKKLESVGVLAGGIAHDFNNILAAIVGNINLALFDEDLKDKTKKLLSAAEQASMRAKDLTHQLLTFAKGGEPVKETSSLKTVIKDSTDFILHGGKVACQYDIPEDLWLADVDKGQISQVIQNIVLNATHAMPEGGMIRISGENHITAGSTFLPDAGGRYVRIAIEDSGIGMPVNAVEKIFDPYFSTKQEGSGLGLAITQSIIQKHNGHITAESSPGSGSTFTIYLPASEKCRTQSRRSLIDVAPPAPVKVLIMDDDAMVRDIAQQMLSHLGPEVVLAPDGEETVTCYQQAIDTTKPFDLVIMDLTIPGGMGGKEAIQEILKFDPDARAIVSSGYSNDPVMADFKKYGFCAAIAKPFQLQDLSRVISRIIA
jgi:two-component system cell cycle sensor histidine kinase/response regulator CckA